MKIIEILEDTICPVISDPISAEQLNQLEQFLDYYYQKFDIDIDLSKNHFVQRVNDYRNKQQIRLCELKELFLNVLKTHAPKLAKLTDNFEGVLQDISTELNLPFVVKYNEKRNELELIAKTIMRKSNFQSKDPIFKVKSGVISKRLKD